MDTFIKALVEIGAMQKNLGSGSKIPVSKRDLDIKKVDFRGYKDTLANYNVGVVSGVDSNLTIIDFDLYKCDNPAFKEKLKKLISSEKLKNIVKTPSGGIHMYFQYSSKIRQTQSGINHVDARNTEGGYVVGPGSMLPSGEYKVFSKPFKIPKMSKAVFSFLEAHTSVTTSKNDKDGDPPKVAKNKSDESGDQSSIPIEVLESQYPGIQQYNFKFIKDVLDQCNYDSYDVWMKVGLTLGRAFSHTKYSSFVYGMYENWAKSSPKWNFNNEKKTHYFFYEFVKEEYEGKKISFNTFINGHLTEGYIHNQKLDKGLDVEALKKTDYAEYMRAVKGNNNSKSDEEGLKIMQTVNDSIERLRDDLKLSKEDLSVDDDILRCCINVVRRQHQQNPKKVTAEDLHKWEEINLYVWDVGEQRIVSLDKQDSFTLKVFKENFNAQIELKSGKAISAAKLIQLTRPTNRYISDASFPQGYVSLSSYRKKYGEGIDCRGFIGAANIFKFRTKVKYTRGEIQDMKKNNPEKAKKLLAEYSKNILWEHMKNVIPSKKDRKILLQFFAHAYHKPDIKQRYAIVLAGGQGTGKDTLSNPIINMMGGSFASSQSIDDIVGANFNEWKMHNFIVFSESDSTKTNKFGVYKTLKEHISGKNGMIEINPKYGKKIYKKDTSSIILNTNYIRTDLHADADDRRYYPIELISREELERKVKEKTDESLAEYFRRINVKGADDYLELEKIANFLAFIDLDDYEPGSCPTSELKSEIQRISQVQEEEYEYAIDRVTEYLDDLGIPKSNDTSGNKVPTLIPFSAILEHIYLYMKQDNSSLQREYVKSKWSKRVSHILKAQGYIQITPRDINPGDKLRWTKKKDNRTTILYIMNHYEKNFSKSKIGEQALKIMQTTL